MGYFLFDYGIRGSQLDLAFLKISALVDIWGNSIGTGGFWYCLHREIRTLQQG